MDEPHDGSLLESSLTIFQPDTILPVQWTNALNRHVMPELRLMAALLEDAVNCFQKYRFAKDRRGQRLFRETVRWLMCRDTDWVFSFERVCETLGLDASYLRRGLLRGSQVALAAGEQHEVGAARPNCGANGDLVR